MKKQKIRLIVSDIDGTILNDQHQVDQNLKDQIPLLKKKNIPFVLASARSPLGMEPIAHELVCYSYRAFIAYLKPYFEPVMKI